MPPTPAAIRTWRQTTTHRLRAVRRWCTTEILCRIADSAFGPVLTPRRRRADDDIELQLASAAGAFTWVTTPTRAPSADADASRLAAIDRKMADFPRRGPRLWLYLLQYQWETRGQFLLIVRMLSPRRQRVHLEVERFYRAHPNHTAEIIDGLPVATGGAMPQCTASTKLPLVETLLALRQADNHGNQGWVQEVLTCELGEHDQGEHAVLVGDRDDQPDSGLWLLWADTEHRLVWLTGCVGTTNPEIPCILYQGHPAVHSDEVSDPTADALRQDWTDA